MLATGSPDSSAMHTIRLKEIASLPFANGNRVTVEEVVVASDRPDSEARRKPYRVIIQGRRSTCFATYEAALRFALEKALPRGTELHGSAQGPQHPLVN